MCGRGAPTRVVCFLECPVERVAPFPHGVQHGGFVVTCMGGYVFGSQKMRMAMDVLAM